MTGLKVFRTSLARAKSRSTRWRRTRGFWRSAAEGLCALDRPASGGGALRYRCAICLALPAQSEDRSKSPQVLVRKQRSGFCLQGSRRRRPLYRPGKAIVLCVDEKPSIQALERAQGYLKLPTGRALTGQSHDYKRHGTTTLFAALDVATGKVLGEHKKRCRRVEFLGFMDKVVAAFPDRELHVVLDNLNTHKKNERWLKKHPRVHFHFTPTRASWLNQIETWFSILQGQSLSGASFTAVSQLQEHMDAFISAWNENAEPFVWTKKKVRQRRFKGRRITQL